jgi:hypothetical protein
MAIAIRLCSAVAASHKTLATYDLYLQIHSAGNQDETEETKCAIPFAATLLCARELIELEPGRPSPAKFAAIENAISQAKFMLDRISIAGCPPTVEVRSSAPDSSLFQTS